MNNEACSGCGCLLVILGFIVLFGLAGGISGLPETGKEPKEVSSSNLKHTSKEPVKKTAQPEEGADQPTVTSEMEQEEQTKEPVGYVRYGEDGTAYYVRSYDKDGNPYVPIRVPGGIQVSELPGGGYRWAFRKPDDGGIETGVADADSIEDIRAVAAKEYNRLLAEVQEQAEEESTTSGLPFHSVDPPLRSGYRGQIRVQIGRGVHTRAEVERIAIDVTRKYGLGTSLVHFFGSKSCITRWDKDEGGVDEWERRYWLCRVAVDSKKGSYEIRKFSAHYYGPNPVGVPDWGDRALR